MNPVNKTPTFGQFLFKPADAFHKTVSLCGVITNITDSRIYYKKLSKIRKVVDFFPQLIEILESDPVGQSNVFKLGATGARWPIYLDSAEEEVTFIAKTNFAFCVENYVEALYIEHLTAFSEDEMFKVSKANEQLILGGYAGHPSKWDLEGISFKTHNSEKYLQTLTELCEKIHNSIDQLEVIV